MVRVQDIPLQASLNVTEVLGLVAVHDDYGMKRQHAS